MRLKRFVHLLDALLIVFCACSAQASGAKPFISAKKHHDAFQMNLLKGVDQDHTFYENFYWIGNESETFEEDQAILQLYFHYGKPSLAYNNLPRSVQGDLHSSCFLNCLELDLPPPALRRSSSCNYSGSFK